MRTQHFWPILLFKTSHIGHYTQSSQMAAKWGFPLLNTIKSSHSLSLNFKVIPKRPSLTPTESNLTGLSCHILYLGTLLISYFRLSSISKYFY